MRSGFGNRLFRGADGSRKGDLGRSGMLVCLRDEKRSGLILGASGAIGASGSPALGSRVKGASLDRIQALLTSTPNLGQPTERVYDMSHRGRDVFNRLERERQTLINEINERLDTMDLSPNIRERAKSFALVAEGSALRVFYDGICKKDSGSQGE